MKLPGKKTKIFVERNSPGSYVNGIWSQPSAKKIGLMANIQPLSGSELLLEKEGSRERKYIKLYTDNELIGIDEANKVQSDKFTYLGDMYEVQDCKEYVTHFLSYYKSVAAKINS